MPATTDPARRGTGPCADVALVIEGLGCGGAQRVASHLVGAWAAAGRRVQVITLRGPEHDYFPLPSEVRRDVIGGAGPARSFGAALVANAGRVRRLRRCLSQGRVGAVVSFMTATNVLTILATRGLAMRVLVSERNDPTRQPMARVWKGLRRALYPRADVVGANSRHALDALTAYVPRHRLILMPNPVVLPAERAQPGSSKAIVSVGRLVAHKRHDLMLDAMASLGPRGAGWRLDLVGDGPEAQCLASRAAHLGLGNRVAFHGLCDPAAVVRAGAIAVSASRYEGSPNALLEAMAYGLPCVVADALPGALEYVEHGVSGLVFRAGDPGHLAESLAALMADPDRRIRLGAAARARVERVRVDRVVGELDDVLFGPPAR